MPCGLPVSCRQALSPQLAIQGEDQDFTVSWCLCGELLPCKTSPQVPPFHKGERAEQDGSRKSEGTSLNDLLDNMRLEIPRGT